MFKSRKGVDSHVRDLFSKVTSESDKIQKCMIVAKQYAAIKDFVSAKRYLETYLQSTSPPNPAEAHKLLGDIQLELSEEENALESYKLAYQIGSRRDALNRVCDLLSQGCGVGETLESRSKWVELQKASSVTMDTTSGRQNGIGKGQYSTNTFVSRAYTSPGGPPKSGMNGNAISICSSSKSKNVTTPLKSSTIPGLHAESHTPKQRGMGTSRLNASPERLYMQMTFLEKKYEDVMERILEQNALVLNGMLTMKEDVSEQVLTGMFAMKEELSKQVLTEVVTMKAELSKQVLTEMVTMKKELSEQVLNGMLTMKEELSNLIQEKGTESKAKMEEMIRLVGNPQIVSQTAVVNPKPAKPHKQDKKEAISEPLKPLTELFKKDAGSWDCNTCYINNKKEAIKCISCETPQPGFEALVTAQKEEAVKKAAAEASSFSFGFQQTNPEAATKKEVETQKPAFTPAFSFGGKTPVSTESTVTTSVTESPLNLFGGVSSAPFSFSLPSTANVESGNSVTSNPNPFSNMNFASLGFGDFSKASPIGAVSKPLDFKGFGGEGKSLFGDFGMNKSVSDVPDTGAGTESNRNRTTSGGADDDWEPDTQFTPVIPLPDLVEAKLGDENENVLFDHRAKIYRFDSDLKEWKERGVGNIKILQDKDQSNRVRILMWRERVLKLACNHRITGNMKVEIFQGNPKVLKWSAVDHSEDGARPEIFTCRFGTEDKSAEFKAKMEEMIQLVASSPNESSPIQTKILNSEPQKQDKKDGTSEPLRPLSELFKKDVGSWDCNTCYINNKKEAIKCISCETPQPGFEAQVTAQKEEETQKASLQFPAFSFGVKTPVTTEPAFSTSTTYSPRNLFGNNSSAPSPRSEEDVNVSKEVENPKIASQIPAFSFQMKTPVSTESVVNTSATDTSMNLFGGVSSAPFSFTLPAVTKPSTANIESGNSGMPNLFTNLNLSSSSPGFGELAKASPIGAFSKPSDFKGFGGEGKSLFGDFGMNKSVSDVPDAGAGTENSRNRTTSGGADDDWEPDTQFTPVIPLPALVEAKLGDENENVLFEHRAKIYRFDSDLKEWKERGVGNIKILQDKDQSNRVRILMWRERVLKLACNHRITGNMKVEIFQGNPKVLKWSAVDHSEDGARPEIFTCRFGTEDKSAEFKAKMEEMIELVASSPNESSPTKILNSEPQKQDRKDLAAEPLRPLSELFKKEVGSWDCNTCYINNKKEAIKCISCETPQPGFEAEVAAQREEADKKAAAEAPSFSFGFKQSTPEAASKKEEETLKPTFTPAFSFGGNTPITTESALSTSATYSPRNLFGGNSSAPPPIFEGDVNVSTEGENPKIASQVPSFAFEIKTPVSTESIFSASATDTSMNLFGSSSSTPFSFTLPSANTPSTANIEIGNSGMPNLFSNLNFSSPGFGDLAKTSPVGAFSKPSDFKGFGGEGKSLFGDIGLNKSINDEGGAGTERTRTTSEGEADGWEPNVDFTPVIPLPALVEAKLGDENENVLFEHRAKIYRFDSDLKEWKERGVGNIKILQDKDQSNRVRILMWRERVLKLACNHRITGNMKVEIFQGNPKVLKWSAVDHSEDGARPEIFTCRFGTEDKSAEFKAKMEEMIELVASSPNESSPTKILNSEPQKQDRKDLAAEPLRPLSELFKKEVGSWDCNTCYINNKKEAIKCISCETPQPGFEAEVAAQREEADKKAAAEAPSFSFGFKQSTSEQASAPVVPSSSAFTFALPSYRDFATPGANQSAIPSTDLKERAKQLQLPEDFYNYESDPDAHKCSGCRGCEPDSFEFTSSNDFKESIAPTNFQEILTVTENPDVVHSAWSSS